MTGDNGVKPLADVGFLDDNGKGTIHERVVEAGLITGGIRHEQRFNL